MAGLEPHMQNVRLEDDEIFSAMRDAFVELGEIPSRAKFDRAFRYSADVFRKRGVDWKGFVWGSRERDRTRRAARAN